MSRKGSPVLLLVLVAVSLCTRVESITVGTKLGKILGTREEMVSGTKYLAFRAIRYASPPTRSQRFKPPVPVSPWEGVMNGTEDGPVCPQLNFGTNAVIGDEDCLTLNVYTKDVEHLRPVVVFIHGGGWSTGTGSSLLYGPNFLVDNFVLVTIQYRLSVLGFLSTGTDEARGNYGLLDQLVSLEWVKENIASFGGDPDRVTLMGEGAGAASVGLLSFTERSRGLFRNGILLGGSPLNSQYFQKDPLESAREIGSRLGCTYDDLAGLVSCLREAEAEKLIREVNQMFSFFSFPRWFAPSVDNVLFSGDPAEMLRDGGRLVKVPILIGLARHEGAFYYPLTLNAFNDGVYKGNFIDQRFPRLLPVISEFERKLLPLTKAIKKRYFTNIDIDNEDEFRPRYIEFLTDLLYTRFSNEYVKGLKSHGVPAYFFIFDYYGSNSIMQVIGDGDGKAIAHGDILQYIFNGVLGEEKELPEDDRNFATSTLIPLLSNFVKTSSPNPVNGFNCPRFESSEVCVVGGELASMPHFRTNILKFWMEEVPKILGLKKDEL